MVHQQATLVYDACYSPAWSATQQALYQNDQVLWFAMCGADEAHGSAASVKPPQKPYLLQVAVKRHLDGSRELSFNNLTVLGASSKAHYHMYGPSASATLVQSTIRCLQLVDYMPSLTPPDLSVLGVPANSTAVSPENPLSCYSTYQSMQLLLGQCKLDTATSCCIQFLASAKHT